MRKNLQILELIRKKRIAKGYSQESLAFDLGISQSYYAKLENSSSNISLKMLIKISKILEISAKEILKSIEDKSEE